MSIPFAVSQAAHLLALLAFGWYVLASVRWIYSRSHAIGWLVTVAIVVRVGLGLTLFWVSYLKLPLAEALQVEGGFWRIALDATGYYEMANTVAVSHTLYPLDHVVPAPFFVNTLAIWMMAVGISPAAGMFLNLCLYVVLALGVVRWFEPVNDWRKDLPALVGLAAYSFAPVILLHSTQPLKDELGNLCIASASVGVLALRRLVYPDLGRYHGFALAGGAAAIAAGVFGISGTRWYYGLIMFGSVALALVLFSLVVSHVGRMPGFARYAAQCVLVLALAWIGFWGGAGPHYLVVGANLERILALPLPRDLTVSELKRSGRAMLERVGAIPSDLSTMTKMSRTGFMMAGGGTNVIVPIREDPDEGYEYIQELGKQEKGSARYQKLLEEQRRREQLKQRRRSEQLEERRRAEQPGGAAGSRSAGPQVVEGGIVLGSPEHLKAIDAQIIALRAVPTNTREHVVAALRGVALIYVPLTILTRIWGLELEGGRGWLAMVDLDTLFLDAALLAVVTLLWARRRTIADRLPLVAFGLILGVTTAILLGYVVTNFGTMWRLRTLAAVPVWLLVMALSPRAEKPRPVAVAVEVVAT